MQNCISHPQPTAGKKKGAQSAPDSLKLSAAYCGDVSSSLLSSEAMTMIAMMMTAARAISHQFCEDWVFSTVAAGAGPATTARWPCWSWPKGSSSQ